MSSLRAQRRNLLMKTCLLTWFAAIAICLSAQLHAQVPVTVSVDVRHPGAEISPDFAGLSLETQMMLPSKDGKYYFSPENKKLIALFHQLGIKSLRIGGNTADRPGIPVPDTRDIDSLFAFARAAGVKVIYTLRLREGDRDKAVELAKYIYTHYRDLVDCLAIGNEPNVFAKEYPVYRDEWRKYFEAITAPGIAPDARFCGPSATPGKTEWARDFAADFGPSGHIAFITQHAYPGGAGNRATNIVAGRDRMLSAEWLAGYKKFYDSFASFALSNGLPYRIEEANNYYNGGANDISDTYAAALWGLDYLRWWAVHGARGINFHTGDQVAAGEKMNVCRYASYVTSETGYAVHPLGYGIRMFELGGNGRIVSATVDSQHEANLTAYAVLAADKRLFVTLINKEHGETGKRVSVKINAGDGYTKGQIISLSAPNGDVAARIGLTIGGAAIADDASWKGQWRASGDIVDLPAASAAVLKLRNR